MIKISTFALLSAVLLTPTTVSTAGGILGKGLGGAAGGMQDWSREMTAAEIQRQRDESNSKQPHQKEPEPEQHQSVYQGEYFEIQKLEYFYPRWVETVRSKEFSDWQDRQPASVQSLAHSPKAKDAILMLDLYERDRASRQAPR